MNVPETMARIADKRMKNIEQFPADMYLIRQEIEIAVAEAIAEALNDVMQESFDCTDENGNFKPRIVK